MLRMPVKQKTTLTFSALVIATLSLVFAVGPIVGNQKALAANLCGSGLGCGGASDYGCNGCISYPSPLSNFFGGEVLDHGFGFYHFHGGFGFHHFGGFGVHHFGGFHHFR
ncbi:MAG: hypothetical protein WAM14_07430 [Candidatus Nitrosopolaris sp.]